MYVTERTKAHAREIYDYISLNPERHSQAHWVGIPRDDRVDYFFHHYDKVDETNVCGSTMCIAGTSVYLKEGIEGLNDCYNETDKYGRLGGFPRRAGFYLGLDEIEADSIFFEMSEQIALDSLLAIAEGDEEKFRVLAELDSF